VLLGIVIPFGILLPLLVALHIRKVLISYVIAIIIALMVSLSFQFLLIDCSRMIGIAHVVALPRTRRPARGMGQHPQHTYIS